MRRLIWLVAAPAALILGMGGQARANFVVNGDFEAVQIGSPFLSTDPSKIPGWTHTGSTGDALLWAVGYSDSGGNITVAGSGKQFVTLGGGIGGTGTGHWQQTLTGLTAGQSYTLTFDMASEGLFSGSQSITVDFPTGSSTGATTFTAGPSAGNYWKSWQEKSMTFVATDTSATLQFSATTQYDVGLDNVRVEAVTAAVPAPPSLVLACLGTVCLVGHAWRRKILATA